MYQIVVVVLESLSGAQAVSASILVAALTGAAAVVTTFVSKRLDRKALVVSELREKKIPACEKILKLVCSFAFSGKADRPKPTPEDTLSKMVSITEEITIWGSDELFKAWHDYRMNALKQEQHKATGRRSTPQEVLLPIADLVLAVRRDLGHKNKGVSRKTVLGMFVNDLPDDFS